ncbi:putative WD repeat-containing protein [Chlorella vulgaris]
MAAVSRGLPSSDREGEDMQGGPQDPFASQGLTCTDAKRLGDAAFQHADFDRAVAAYSAALQAAAEDPHMRGILLLNRCLAKLRLGGQASSALADAQEACRMRPRWGKAHLRLAQTLETCGRPDAAAASYQRAAELDPELAQAVGKALAGLERKDSRRRCLVAMQGHQGPVYDADVHPQSVTIGSLPTQLVATAGADHTIRLWCTSTGCQLQALRAHQDRVTRLRWSPCGSLLASASLEGGTRLWHLHPSVLAASPCGTSTQLLAPGAVLQGDEAEGRTSCLAFNPDSSLLATGSSTGTVRLWATAGGEAGSHQKLGGHGSLVSSVCFSPCGTLLASASGDKACRVWSTATGDCVADIAWDCGPVNFCRFVQYNDGGTARALLLTCHVDQQRQEGRVMMWDVLEQREGWVDGKLVGPAASIDNFRGKVTSLDTCCGCGELASLLAAACSDGSMRVVDLDAVAAVAPGNTVGAKAASAPLLEILLPDGVAVENGVMMPGWQSSTISQLAHDRNLVALSPDGGLLAAVGPDRRILVMEAEGVSQAQAALALVGHVGLVRVLRWLGCGQRLLSAGEDGVVRVWQAGRIDFT